MGANLALNIAEKGFPIAVYNRTWEKTEAFLASSGALHPRIVACKTFADFAAAIRPPRPVIIMVKAGEAVDEQIANLREVLEPRDIIIDAGNANFHDTIRRDTALNGTGLQFIGMGVSGGEEGARHGPSIMVGGPEACYHRVEKVLTAIAAKYRKPLRQDDPQRHRVCRHADDRRGLWPDARWPAHEGAGDLPGVRALE
jgi:6-phosphogluconate dehydrogenase